MPAGITRSRRPAARSSGSEERAAVGIPPSWQLYPRLASDRLGAGIASLRVPYRQPGCLDECVADTLAGIHVLESQDIAALALVGHSFGGAVVINAAARDDRVRAIVTLATQSHGADPIAALAPRCASLLIHGTADTILPETSSGFVYSLAHEPKRLIVHEGAGHGLNEAAESVTAEVRDWILEWLPAAAGSTRLAR